MKRTIILVLCLFGLAFCFAEGVAPNGAGTSINPYLINSVDNLLWISTNPGTWIQDVYFRQIADIDASETQNWNGGEGFDPIGWRIYFDYSDPFQATYNGNGHSISGLYINRPNENSIGLFGYTYFAEIENLNVIYSNVIGYDYVGTIVGFSLESEITNCNSGGTVFGHNSVGGVAGYVKETYSSGCENTSAITGWDYVGGVFGRVIDCTVLSAQNLGLINGNDYVGGCLGYVEDQSSVAHSSSESDVSGNMFVGGFAGLNSEQSVMNRCFTINSVISGEEYVGGFVGNNYLGSDITSSYAENEVSSQNIGGGFFGRIEGATEIVNCGFPEDSVVNSPNIIRIGSLDNDLYLLWQNSDLHLEAEDFYSAEGDYFLISNETDFLKLKLFGQYPDGMYKLTNNLDFSAYPNEYVPLFKGVFDGMENFITNLNITSSYHGVGLFGCVYDSEIKSLSITNSTVMATERVGLLSGIAWNSSISFCEVEGSVTGNRDVGGIIGLLAQYSGLSSSSAHCTVTGEDRVGGFCGEVSVNTSIHDCYNMGTVSGQSTVGGFVGVMGTMCDISKVYSSVQVSGEEITGGLIGLISNSQFYDSVWNSDYSGLTDPYGNINWTSQVEAVDADSIAMRDINTYLALDWDFAGETTNGTDDFWHIAHNVNEGYPTLQDAPTSLWGEEVVSTIQSLGIYPNPFKGTTNIYFTIDKGESGKLSIYNIKGQKISSYEYSHGKHNYIWDGSDYRSGVYFYRLTTDKSCITKSMILLK